MTTKKLNKTNYSSHDYRAGYYNWQKKWSTVLINKLNKKNEWLYAKLKEARSLYRTLNRNYDSISIWYSDIKKELSSTNRNLIIVCILFMVYVVYNIITII